MKKEDLIALGIADDVAEKVFALHGKGLEPYKTQLATAQAEAETLKTQLTEAGATIEGFKKMDVDGIKAAADDYKAKFEQATSEAAKQMAALKFDHALESALAGAKARNAKAVQALLNKELLKLNDADGSIVGLTEQLEAIRKDNDYLFADTKEPPKIVAGGNSKSVIGDPVIDAARRAAGLVTEPK